AASVAITLAALAAAFTRAGRRYLAARVPIPRIRMTLFRGMVVIGASSACLWLLRFDIYLLLCGTFVFAIMLYAGFRRSYLSRTITANGVREAILSRAGLAGYAIAVFLALAWVTAIIFWDSYQQVLHGR